MYMAVTGQEMLQSDWRKLFNLGRYNKTFLVNSNHFYPLLNDGHKNPMDRSGEELKSFLLHLKLYQNRHVLIFFKSNFYFLLNICFEYLNILNICEKYLEKII